MTQAIAGLSFRLSAASVALPTGDTVIASEQLSASQQLSDVAFEETRRAITGLHSPVLEDLGLGAALVSLARSIPQVAVHADVEDVELPGHMEKALFRIAQEAVRNAVKLSRAGLVVVALRTRGRQAVLSVIDDGVGFDAPGDLCAPPRRGPGEHYGLTWMYERVQLLEGELSIESAPGRGTVVEVVVDLGAIDGNQESDAAR